jgi:hypothetical protein
MGSDTGVLYVHSAVNEWKRCLHADKLPSSMQAIVYVYHYRYYHYCISHVSM